MTRLQDLGWFGCFVSKKCYLTFVYLGKVKLYFDNFGLSDVLLLKSVINWYTFCTILYHVKFFFSINNLNSKTKIWLKNEK